jgi:hypothetical protein
MRSRSTFAMMVMAGMMAGACGSGESGPQSAANPGGPPAQAGEGASTPFASDVASCGNTLIWSC